MFYLLASNSNFADLRAKLSPHFFPNSKKPTETILLMNFVFSSFLQYKIEESHENKNCVISITVFSSNRDISYIAVEDCIVNTQLAVTICARFAS